MTNIDTTNGLLGDLEAKFGPAMGQHILDELQRAEFQTKPVQFIDVKESSEKLERIRKDTLAAVEVYREAKREYHNRKDRYLASLQTKRV